VNIPFQNIKQTKYDKGWVKIKEDESRGKKEVVRVLMYLNGKVKKRKVENEKNDDLDMRNGKNECDRIIKK
jgi:hypothetical protein